MTIDQLKEQEKELNFLLSKNRNNQRELNKISFVEKHGINIGDKVTWVAGKVTRIGIISCVEFSGVTPNYFKATLINSNGSPGKREVRIWSYSTGSIKKLTIQP